MIKFSSLRLCALLGMLTAPMSAGTIVISYSGTIDSSSIPGISAGDAFTGSATYLSTSRLIATGTYSLDNPGDSLLLAVDGFSFSANNSPYIELQMNGPDPLNGRPSFDIFNFVPGQGLSTNYPLSGQTFLFDDASFQGNAGFLTSLDLPTTFDPANVTYGNVPPVPTAVTVTLSGGSLTGFVSSIAITDTPEPSTSVALFTALCLLAAYSRRQTRI